MAAQLIMHFQLLVIWIQITTQNSLIYLKLYTLDLTSPLSQRTSGALSPQIKKLRVKPITHLCLVPKLRMSGSIPPIPLFLHGVQRINFTFTYVKFMGGIWRWKKCVCYTREWHLRMWILRFLQWYGWGISSAGMCCIDRGYVVPDI